MGLFMTQMFGQPLIVRTAKVTVQQAVQAGFQASVATAMRRNCSSLVTIPQAEALLQQGLGARGNEAAARGGHLDQLPATTDRVLQATLMKLLRKPIETPRPVVHQKTRVVLSRGAGGRELRKLRRRCEHPEIFQSDPLWVTEGLLTSPLTRLLI